MVLTLRVIDAATIKKLTGAGVTLSGKNTTENSVLLLQLSGKIDSRNNLTLCVSIIARGIGNAQI